MCPSGREESTTENSSMDISSSQFIKNAITFDVTNGVNRRIVHRVLCENISVVQVLLQFLDPLFHHQVLLNIWGECMYESIS